MVRPFLPRLPLLRGLASRVSYAPLLPVSRLRPLTSLPGLRHNNSHPFHHHSARHSNAPSSPNSSPQPPHTPLPPGTTLSQRLRHLIKAYGWYALGVYLAFSALDFGVAFVGINLLGAEYVAQIAANVKNTIADFLPSRPAEPGLDELESTHRNPSHGGQEGLYAMLVLAYTIHKTLFLPVRVGLTAAFTPKLVGWLGRRGWTGTEGTRRAAAEMRERLRERSRQS